MNWKLQLEKYGYIKTFNDSGKKVTIKNTKKTNKQENIDMCLNCKKRKCKGTCVDIRRKSNETENGNY